MKKTIVFCLFFPVFISGLGADLFAFKFIEGDAYRIVTMTSEDVYLNGRLSHRTDFLNKISLKITDAENGSGTFSGLFQVSKRVTPGQGVFIFEEESSSAYSVDPRGRFSIDPSYLFPLTQDIPVFSGTDVQPGDVWNAVGTEIHDLRSPYGIARPYRIPVNVRYAYAGTRTVDGRTLAQIDIQYSYLAKVTPETPATGRYYPVMISGMIHKVYFFDVERGRMSSYTEDFDVFYHLSNGAVVEFTGKHSGRVIQARDLDARRAAEDINREIEKRRLEGVRAEATDRGVKITLEDIMFQPDSDLITAGESGKIEVIASILGQLPGYDIKLVGHTAAVGTPESCLDLSLRRARAVADALRGLGARTEEEMTVQGKGLSEPVAPNDTEAGRARNRRVEIFILEN